MKDVTCGESWVMGTQYLSVLFFFVIFCEFVIVWKAKVFLSQMGFLIEINLPCIGSEV